MAADPNAIGQQGRVPYSYGGNAMPHGNRPHIPVVMQSPQYHHWLVGGRKQRASQYAEALASVGVNYAPVSTFAQVMRPVGPRNFNSAD